MGISSAWQWTWRCALVWCNMFQLEKHVSVPSAPVSCTLSLTFPWHHLKVPRYLLSILSTIVSFSSFSPTHTLYSSIKCLSYPLSRHFRASSLPCCIPRCLCGLYPGGKTQQQNWMFPERLCMVAEECVNSPLDMGQKVKGWRTTMGQSKGVWKVRGRWARRKKE